MSAIDAMAEQLYEKLGRGSQADTKTLSQALLAAENRGREEAAKVAERRVPIQGYTNRDLGALTEPAYRDGPEIAAAIRSGQ